MRYDEMRCRWLVLRLEWMVNEWVKMKGREQLRSRSCHMDGFLLPLEGKSARNSSSMSSSRLSSPTHRPCTLASNGERVRGSACLAINEHHHFHLHTSAHPSIPRTTLTNLSIPPRKPPPAFTTNFPTIPPCSKPSTATDPKTPSSNS